MKVLFVSSGNSKKFEIAPFIKSQGEDLINKGVEVDFFTIKGKGLKGYLKNIYPLRKKIKENNYDLIHAHYVLSAWVAILIFSRKKIIASFMGSDTYGDVDINGKRKLSSYREIIFAKLIQPLLNQIIVKSPNLEKYIFIKSKCQVVANGVNMNKFKELNLINTREELGLLENKKYVLFLSDPRNKRKNFKLAKEAFNTLDKKHIELITPYPVPHKDIVKYLNAADVLVFSSYLEGSPNIVKEAMCCNLPIVTVDTGDARDVVDKVDGCYLAHYDITDFSSKLKLALKYNGKTKGRDKIIEMGLDSNTVAKKIIDIYKKVLA